jgi:hypothetical protein
MLPIDNNNNRSARVSGTRFINAARDVVTATFQLNEVDRYILQLNQQGHSIGKISKLLNELYNIQLSKSSVNRHLMELMQDTDNNVQRNYECPIQKPKEEQKWYKVVLELQRYFPEYERTWGSKPSSRTAFYDMQDKHLITSRDAETFTRVTVQARLGWVDYEGNLMYPKLPIDCFSDEKDHSVTASFYGNNSPSEPTPPTPIPDWNEYIDFSIERLKKAPLYYSGRGEPGRPGKIGGYWYDQEEYTEVWEEKVDLVTNFEELLKEKQVKIRGNGGFPSLMFLNKCCLELMELISSGDFEPQNIHIKYCGDWDPSGAQIDSYIQRRVKQLGIEDIDFQRVMITPEQIEQFNLPLMNIDKDPNKKAANPNLAEFRRLYGNKATHLNAMMTLEHREHTKKILFDAIDQHHDPDVYQDMIDEYDCAEPDEPDSLTEEELAEVRQGMIDRITGAFGKGWDRRYYRGKSD